MANDKSDQADAAKRGIDPGTTTWADGSRTDDDLEAGDLTTETGKPLRNETGQPDATLEDVAHPGATPAEPPEPRFSREGPNSGG